MLVASVTAGIRPGQQQRSIDTAERILDALQELTRQKAMQAITVSEILEVAEVSPSSFYRRFRDRDAALVALIERIEAAGRELAHQCVEALLGAPDLRTGVRRVLCAYAAFTEEFDDLGRDFQSPAFRARQDRIDRGVHEVFDAVATILLGESDPYLAQQLEVLGRTAGLAVQRCVRRGGLHDVIGVERDRIVDHMTDVIVGWIEAHASSNVSPVGEAVSINVGGIGIGCH